MTDETGVQDLLGLETPPVAVGFLDAPPPGVERWAGGPRPAGCAFWREAQAGRAFYTLPEDHYNCAVGAYTHGIPLPVARAGELEQTVGFMVQGDYIRMDEVAGIPTLQKSPAVIAYAPADQASFTASAVVIAARPAQAMLIYEAALASGASGALLPALGRPGCAVLPLAGNTGQAALSFGCQGNRTYTGLPDDQFYVCVPGPQWEVVASKVAAVVAANGTMSDYYRRKQERLQERVSASA